jgi:hypothetical protein
VERRLPFAWYLDAVVESCHALHALGWGSSARCNFFCYQLRFVAQAMMQDAPALLFSASSLHCIASWRFCLLSEFAEYCACFNASWHFFFSCFVIFVW